MKNMICVLDTQFGSTGKGNVVGWLGQNEHPDVLVTAWAPNAGHTSIVNGVKLIHTQLANGIQSKELRYVLLGPGSVINLPVLIEEIEKANALTGCTFQLVIHPNASILLPEDAEIESTQLFKIGSTMKGSMAAVVRKMGRVDDSYGIIGQAIEAGGVIQEHWVALQKMMKKISGKAYCDKEMYQHVLATANTALFEGCQGYGLGINSGIYPYCTSRECTFAQMMLDTAMPKQLLDGLWSSRIIGVARTFPIRVANRYDEDGNQIGTSGPGWHDQKELTWDEVGQPPEITTVTLLERRVFEFSPAQVVEAAYASGMDEVIMTFADYVNDRELIDLVESVQRLSRGEVKVSHCAFGPKETDIRPWPTNR